MILQNINVGFLGGGQLARMMILECHKLGLNPWVYCESASDPAAQVCTRQVLGKLDDSKKLIAFIEGVDLLTFESEFVPKQILKQIMGLGELQNKIFPAAACMLVLQNRESQKSLLEEYKIPSARSLPVNNLDDLISVWQKWKQPFVLKKNFGGYDGNGTYFLNSENDVTKFCQEISFNSEGYIAETRISFKRELACIFVRSASGIFLSLPLVETKQSFGRCDWVWGPIKHRQFATIEKKFKRMLGQINYVGCMGVEMFDTGKDLYINELAPRVHNSGHYSQAALNESQFLLHLKAGLDLAFDKPQLLAKAFVMTNLVGKSSQAIDFPQSLNGQLNMYGKFENRLGRKMGHINYLGNSAKSLLTQALKERRKIKL